MLKKSFAKITLSFSVVALLAACQPQNGMQPNTGIGGTNINKSQVGTLAGALAGGFAGSNLGKGSGKTLGIAAGALLGGLVGGSIGQSLDNADQQALTNTAQSAFETGKTGAPARWSNPDSGNSGVITPTRTFQTAQGQYCREFSQNINVGGQRQEAFGTACRQNDGSWKIVQ
jgi:surface antigen